MLRSLVGSEMCIRDSMNGFTIIGNEKIQSPQKNLPSEKQLSVGHAIGDETHIALFKKQWKSKTITTKYYINFKRKYVNAKKTTCCIYIFYSGGMCSITI